jgi:V-type H+-transporting ATPase subunit a
VEEILIQKEIDPHMKSKERMSEEQADLDDCVDEEGGEAHSSAGEIFIHGGIETIEFVLGGIAHTASYLRLWALSLAHSQLAKVFFRLVMGNTIKAGNGVLQFAGAYIWCFITFAVLMLMDTMECLLHALRLHW